MNDMGIGILHGADDEEKFGKRDSDFNLRIYSLQKLFNQSPWIAKKFPLYEDSLKVLCLENSLKFVSM